MNPKKQILFVDDDELVLFCYERMFGGRYTIETALGAMPAIEALKHSSYAVIASDLRMPGMNGVELLRKVKESSPETVGILLTGNPELDEIDASTRENLCFKLLEKPCRTTELIVAIEEALKQFHANTRAGVL